MSTRCCVWSEAVTRVRGAPAAADEEQGRALTIETSCADCSNSRKRYIQATISTVVG